MIKRIAGPAYLASSVANIYTPPNSAVFTVIRHIHFCNVTTSTATATLYVGATGGSTGGTEIFKSFSVPANDVFDYPCQLYMASTDFLTGKCTEGATNITITVEGEFLAS